MSNKVHSSVCWGFIGKDIFLTQNKSLDMTRGYDSLIFILLRQVE